MHRRLAFILVLFLVATFDVEAKQRAIPKKKQSQKQLTLKEQQEQRNAASAVTQELLKKVNDVGIWKATQSMYFLKKTRAEAIQLMGWKEDELFRKQTPRRYLLPVGDSIPKSFDALEEWPSCTSIGKIYDQDMCGTSFAIAAVSTMQDRLCIATDQEVQEELSLQEALFCAAKVKDCKPGDAATVWAYAMKEGIVTASCSPENSKCTKDSSCAENMCPNSCQSTDLDWDDSKYFVKTFYLVKNKVEQIQREIIEHGPVEACMTVYDDFFAYSRGVYTHLAGAQAGRHCVKLIGWGEEEGDQYWIGVNSWGKLWGEAGKFKIKRGVDECKIESYVIAGTFDI